MIVKTIKQNVIHLNLVILRGHMEILFVLEMFKTETVQMTKYNICAQLV